MRETYIELMEQALSAYSDEHILRYFNDVKTVGLTEHGFPRLTANIGILIAHGRRVDLLPLFREMMEFCCKTMPTVQAANDFSVREIVCCIWELERSGVCSEEEIARWRGYLTPIDRAVCYNRFALTPTDSVRNWALFTALSEFFRIKAGLVEDDGFVELQLVQQLQWMDENGMYRDNSHGECHQPVMYDLVPRGLFCLLLQYGYRGPSYERIDGYLKRAARMTLDMQSPCGEMAFGGRSNQFLHNEAWMAVVFEFEASRYMREGDMRLAGIFKSAAARAVRVSREWLAKRPIRHVKNCFPTETGFGCERYAYFDKYMITVASNYYVAYLLCDDSIPSEELPDVAPAICETSSAFHKLFLKSGGYGLEFDTNGDPEYDASGLGRLHRAGAPTALCLSVPCPAAPHYTLDLEPRALSLCGGLPENGGWHFVCDGASCEEAELTKDERYAYGKLRWRWEDGRTLTERYRVGEDGVDIEACTEGEIAYLLPAFHFDGASHTHVEQEKTSLCVTYEGWSCRFVSDGEIRDLEWLGANRNGHYRAFAAMGESRLRIRISIEPSQKNA